MKLSMSIKRPSYSEVLEWLYEQNLVQALIINNRGYNHPWIDDYIGETFIEITNIDEKKLIDLYMSGELKAYVSGLVVRSLTNKGNVYRRIKRWSANTVELNEALTIADGDK